LGEHFNLSCGCEIDVEVSIDRVIGVSPRCEEHTRIFLSDKFLLPIVQSIYQSQKSTKFEDKLQVLQAYSEKEKNYSTVNFLIQDEVVIPEVEAQFV
jgi:proline dehydrogenase